MTAVIFSVNEDRPPVNAAQNGVQREMCGDKSGLLGHREAEADTKNLR